ncbi:MAG: hypothetical protein PHV32_03020 [Eubacteriales bacterium]|nr:hypothetical protein [Eubacteriales bacterium]
MQRNRRPGGRDKRVSQGSADAFRRDESIDVSGVRPVGKSDGYEDRKSGRAKAGKGTSSRGISGYGSASNSGFTSNQGRGANRGVSPEISNMKLQEISCKVTYKLTDVYQNTYWTPTLDY